MNRIARSLYLAAACSILLAAGCQDRQPSGAAIALPPPLPVQAIDVRRHPQSGRPSFAWITNRAGQSLAAPAGATATERAWATLVGLAPQYGLSASGLAAAQLAALHDTGTGAIVARFTQQHDGVEIFAADMSIGLGRDLRPWAAAGALVPEPTVRPGSAFRPDTRRAIEVAYSRATGRALGVDQLSGGDVGADGYARHRIASPGGQHSGARSKRVWFAGGGGLVAAHYLELDLASAEARSPRLRSLVVSDDDDAILFENDLTASDGVAYRVWADQGGPLGAAPQVNIFGQTSLPHPTGLNDDTLFDPISPSLVSVDSLPFSRHDPWLPAGATELFGNNAHAYADIASPDGLDDNDLRVAPTAPAQYDRAFDATLDANVSPEQIRATTTQLFFTINYMHDLFYDAGFDERANNPQLDNFGRGGWDRDPILAESQDSSGSDNANASTPADGQSPRIQMYLWHARAGRVVVQPTTGAHTVPPAMVASFGPRAFVVTGSLVRVDDAGATTHGACGTLANADALRDKIALVDADGCDANIKALALQTAGARGMILSGGTADPFGTSDAALASFPALALNATNGSALVTLAGTQSVQVTLRRQPVLRDSSLDTTVVSHEWGHVLSNRIIGNGNGLQNQLSRGLGEGWSDFVALLTTVRPDAATVPPAARYGGVYPAAQYAADDVYFGIRRFPYSVDFARNPLTLRHTSDQEQLPKTAPSKPNWAANSEVHNTGEIWATMLWECYVALLRDSPRLSFGDANARMRSYLVASLKLTPNNPTLLDARNALLAVARATDLADYRLFGHAFARRGAGIGASGPLGGGGETCCVTESYIASDSDIQITGAAFAAPPSGCDGDRYLDSGENGTLVLTVRNTGFAPLQAAKVTVTSSSPSVSISNGGAITVPALQPLETTTVSVPLSLYYGLTEVLHYQLQAVFSGGSFAQPVQSSIDLVGNADDVPGTSRVDDFGSPLPTRWSTPTPLAGPPEHGWQHVPARDGSGLVWQLPTDVAATTADLVSPTLVVDPAATLTVRVRHRVAFAVNYLQQGGVVELSADDGAHWTDVGSAITEHGYNGVVASGSTVLRDRKAFVGQSEGYPGWLDTTINLGTTYRGKSVRLRFRGASAWNDGLGWELSRFEVSGTTNLPFVGQQADAHLCQHHRPIPDAGARQIVDEGATVTLHGSAVNPDGRPLSFCWRQSNGPLVPLSAECSASPTFVAPAVDADTTLGFELTVSDGVSFSDPAPVEVLVRNVPVMPPDLSMVDMTAPPDLAVAPDLAMAPPPDLATTPDDLASPDDLSPGAPPDLATPLPQHGGCGGCTVARANAPSSAGWLVLGVVVASLLRRRRHRQA